MTDSAGNWVLWSAGLAAFFTVVLSSHLISQHFTHYNMPQVQKKIIGILYMAPIYAVDSFLSILYPPAAIYINMLRDCYEAYVLYLFLSLMLAFLNSDEDDYEVTVYLETKLPYKSHKQYGKGSLSKGKAFLRYCKFGVLQYCVIRPMTAVFAMLFSAADVYNEGDFSPTNSNIYLLFLINCSVLYAFTTLANFYYALKEKLAPFEPVGKFLVIKFVIFFAFWQSVIVTGLVFFNIIDHWGDYRGKNEVGIIIQDYLICVEMVIVSMANYVVFSWKPFTEQAILQDTLNLLHANQSTNELDAEMEITLYEGNGKGYIPPSKKAVVSSGTGSGRTSLQKTSQIINKGSTRLSLAIHKGIRSKSGYRSVSTSSTDVELALNQGDGGEDDTLLHDRLIVNGEEDAAAAAAQAEIADLEDPYVQGVRSEQKAKPAQPPPPPPRLAQPAAEPAPPTTVKDKAKLIAQKLGWGTSSLAQSGGIHEIMDRHFATSSAIRDFNESMPVVVLPTTFKAQRGVVIQSNPADRLAQAQQASSNAAAGRSSSNNASTSSSKSFISHANK